MNFNLMYLGTAYTIMQKLNCTLEEAEIYKAQYEKNHRVLYAWKRTVISEARRKGYVTTYYGRPRRLRDYLSSTDYRRVMFGKRSAVNSMVQGTGADVLKLALSRVNARMQKELSNGSVIFYPTVHDELNFCVREECIQDLVPKIMDAMRVQESDWVVPLDVAVEIGRSWGSLFPFHLEKESMLLVPTVDLYESEEVDTSIKNSILYDKTEEEFISDIDF